MEGFRSNIHVEHVNMEGNSRLHVGNVVHIHQPVDRCLMDLRSIDPKDDKARIEAIKGGLLKKSYDWILTHKDFQSWLNDENKHLLWIRGDPGKGKTMLHCGIINELEEKKEKKDKTGGLLSYFFCQASDRRMNSATAVLRGLVYMLVKDDASLLEHVQKRYKSAGDALFKDSNAFFALSEILSNILKDLNKQRQQTYIVIDALDECVTDLGNLLRFLEQKSGAYSHVKWLVSSRDWPQVTEGMEMTEKMSIRLELNEASISKAVSAYIDHRVERLTQSKGYKDTMEKDIRQYLKYNSNNTFLWVALVCRNLEKITLKSATQLMKECPPGLDAVYERMIKQIQKLEPDVVQFCGQILATVSHVYRPLNLAELGMLIGCADSDKLAKAIGYCGSFLAERHNKVYMIHHSAKDYLTSDKVSDRALRPSSTDIHSKIVERSVRAMSGTLRKDMYNLNSPSITFKEIKPPSQDPLRNIGYSCLYWIDHLTMSQSKDKIDDDQCLMVLAFFRGYFLYWLEALGLLGHAQDSVVSMIQLGKLLKGKSSDAQSQEPAHDPMPLISLHIRFKNVLRGNLSGLKFSDCHMKLLNFVQDSQRFIWRNSLLIAKNPLQVYSSALILSPSNSVIRKEFEIKEAPKWLQIKPTVEYNWSPYLQTLRGHGSGVYSVAISSDGRYLASGSRDKTIKIWDVTTGKERQTLKGHKGSITSLAFTPDGHFLASGSEDKTIKIWDKETGKAQLTISEGIDSMVTSVAYSPDGKYLASGSESSSVKIWNPETGKRHMTLQDHEGPVTSVAYSPNGKYLASGSRDKTVKIWEVATGKKQKTLRGHEGPVNSVAFSPDGKYLASASDDKTAMVWVATATSYEELQTLQSQADFVTSVAFSANNLLAVASRDKTVTVWDMPGGKTAGATQTLHGHSLGVNSVAFSQIDGYLASGSEDGTIKLWDASVRREKKDVAVKEQQSLQGHSHTLTSLCVSPDARYLATASFDTIFKLWDTTHKKQYILHGHGDLVKTVAFSADTKHLASGSLDRTIKIWDMHGKLEKTLDGHSKTVTAVAFSADGKVLVSGSEDKDVKIWDREAGKEKKTLKGHNNIVTSVAISANSHYIASGSRDSTINIWNNEQGKLEKTLVGHKGPITSLAFSRDGRYLASGSHDETIRLWKVEEGKEHQVISTGIGAHAISFGESDSYLQTEVGLLELDLAHKDLAVQKARYVGYSLSADRCWITWNGESRSRDARSRDARSRDSRSRDSRSRDSRSRDSRSRDSRSTDGRKKENIVWLPPDYRSSFHSAIWGKTPGDPTSEYVDIALGNDSGRVTILKLSGKGPYPLL
ncbi:WD40-repeat-containing domain protein [Trichoderma austrokoningii]